MVDNAKEHALDLLSNHPEENHFNVTMKNHHILFSTMQSSRRIGKHKYDRELLAIALAELPLKERQSIRHLSKKIQVPTTTYSAVRCQRQASFQA
jgi:hypothetical protein